MENAVSSNIQTHSYVEHILYETSSTSNVKPPRRRHRRRKIKKTQDDSKRTVRQNVKLNRNPRRRKRSEVQQIHNIERPPSYHAMARPLFSNTRASLSSRIRVPPRSHQQKLSMYSEQPGYVRSPRSGRIKERIPKNSHFSIPTPRDSNVHPRVRKRSVHFDFPEPESTSFNLSRADLSELQEKFEYLNQPFQDSGISTSRISDDPDMDWYRRYETIQGRLIQEQQMLQTNIVSEQVPQTIQQREFTSKPTPVELLAARKRSDFQIPEPARGRPMRHIEMDQSPSGDNDEMLELQDAISRINALESELGTMMKSEGDRKLHHTKDFHRRRKSSIAEPQLVPIGTSRRKRKRAAPGKGKQPKVVQSSSTGGAEDLQGEVERPSISQENVLDTYRESEDTIVRLQSRVRGNHARSKTRSRQESITKIQARVRGKQTRRKLSKTKVSKPYATEEDARILTQMQARARGNSVRRHIRLEREQLEYEKNVTKIQALQRGRLARKRAQHARRKVKSECEENEEVQKECITIQSSYRGHAARKHLARLSKAQELDSNSKITLVQSAIRRCICEFQVQRMSDDKEVPAKVVETSKVRPQITSQPGESSRKPSATKADKLKMKKEISLKENESTTKIQAQWRGKQARKKVNSLRKENKSATKIQSQWRGKQARKEVKRLRQENKSATKIQSQWRGKKARKKAGKMKKVKRDDKIFRIQAICRGMLTRTELESMFDHRRIVQIQARARGNIARKKIPSLPLRHRQIRLGPDSGYRLEASVEEWGTEFRDAAYERAVVVKVVGEPVPPLPYDAAGVSVIECGRHSDALINFRTRKLVLTKNDLDIFGFQAASVRLLKTILDQSSVQKVDGSRELLLEIVR
eukprot:167830_1